MIVDNPEVTLAEDGHGYPDDAEQAAFLDWMCTFVAHGDDGRQYWIGCSPLSLKLERLDMWHLDICWETGPVRDLPGSVYKVADFPQHAATAAHSFPLGTLTIDRFDDRVEVTLGDFRLTCRPDNTWHYQIEDETTGLRADFVHTGAGYRRGTERTNRRR